MQIRAIEKKNLSEINRLYELQQEAYKVEADRIGVRVDLFYPLKETLDELQNSTDEIFVSLADGLITGAISLEKLEGSLLISKLVVDPKFFRRGIAKALVGHCFKLYPKEEFQVGTGATNSPAINLYQSFRFEIFKEIIVEPDLRVVKLRRPLT